MFSLFLHFHVQEVRHKTMFLDLFWCTTYRSLDVPDPSFSNWRLKNREVIIQRTYKEIMSLVLSTHNKYHSLLVSNNEISKSLLDVPT